MRNIQEVRNNNPIIDGVLPENYKETYTHLNRFSCGVAIITFYYRYDNVDGFCEQCWNYSNQKDNEECLIEAGAHFFTQESGERWDVECVICERKLHNIKRSIRCYECIENSLETIDTKIELVERNLKRLIRTQRAKFIPKNRINDTPIILLE